VKSGLRTPVSPTHLPLSLTCCFPLSLFLSLFLSHRQLLASVWHHRRPPHIAGKRRHPQVPYSCLTGRPPHHSPSPTSHGQNKPENHASTTGNSPPMCRNPATHTTVDLLYKLGVKFSLKSVIITTQSKLGFRV